MSERNVSQRSITTAIDFIAKNSKTLAKLWRCEIEFTVKVPEKSVKRPKRVVTYNSEVTADKYYTSFEDGKKTETLIGYVGTPSKTSPPMYKKSVRVIERKNK